MIRNGTFRLEGKREKTPDIIYLYGTEKAIGTLNLRLWVGDDTIRVSANSEVPETWIVENNMPQQAEEDFYRQLKGKDNIIKTSRMNSRQLWDRSLTPGQCPNTNESNHTEWPTRADPHTQPSA